MTLAIRGVNHLILRRLGSGSVPLSARTVHLLRTPANAAHLLRSLEQAERGDLLARMRLRASASPSRCGRTSLAAGRAGSATTIGLSTAWRAPHL